LYPRYRDQGDTSSGFHVHDDYLEYLIEQGPPGLALLLALPIGVLACAFRRPDILGNSKRDFALEAGALAGGVVGVFAHSIVDFNLYVIPTDFLPGLWMARVQHQSDLIRRYPRLPATSQYFTSAARIGVVAAISVFVISRVPHAVAAAEFQRAKTA